MGSDQAYTAKEIAEMTGKSERAARKRSQKEQWPYIETNGNGKNGKTRKYPLAGLPSDIQNSILIYIKDTNPETAPAKMAEMLPALSPSVAANVAGEMTPMPYPSLAEVYAGMTSPFAPSRGGQNRESWTPETAINERDLQNPRIVNILAILRDVEAMPRNYPAGRRKYIEIVALKHKVRWQSIYRWLAKYEKKGIAGLRHTKSSKDKPKKWSPDAVDFWLSLCLKREHRDADRKDMYEILAIEANRRGWDIGGYDSAIWWYNKRSNPMLEAMQRGGLRALDNILPPIIRDYSDLDPFELLVGDQHRFDRWVMDDETGEVFRPEGYLWQDLRTRIIYGAAVDRKYDSWLIGLALRIGIACYGVFGSIYTDNGKPECSKFLAGILANMRALGMGWERTDDAIADITDIDAEDIAPYYMMPGSHRKAVVKNAKAKMIEGTFYRLERIMASRFLLPGQTKKLADDIHWQDIDHQEAIKLAKDGRLLTAREFALAMYGALDYYNREKAHRGVLREWAWKPRPKDAAPWDCLRACHEAGWQPRMISNEAADLLFLAKDKRIIHQGRIQFNNEFYEHDELMPLHKKHVDIRYNPMTMTELHIFQGGRYLCTAVPVEKSSMIDADLASRKIAEKRERRKRFAEEFRKISSVAPDFRNYSQVPEAERVAALIGDDKRKRAAAQIEFNRELSQEELDREVAKLEQGLPMPVKTRKPLPERPGLFLDEYSRFEWIIGYLKAGGELSPEDDAFKTKYMTAMPEDQRQYWNDMAMGE